jgi:flagellar M-ring protein FliF
VGVVLDTQALGEIQTTDVQTLVASALGVDEQRGDTVEVTSMPFDRTAEEDAAAQLEAAEKEESRAEMMSMAKTGGLVLLVLLVLLAAWRQSRRRMKAREQATSYVVEQLRRNEPPAAVASPLAAPAIDTGTSDLRLAARDEIAALVEKQPEEVAQLLRGWLVEADR